MSRKAGFRSLNTIYERRKRTQPKYKYNVRQTVAGKGRILAAARSRHPLASRYLIGAQWVTEAQLDAL